MTEPIGELTAEEWEAAIEQNRAEKDEFFDEHRQSPIPPDHRDEFDGLQYFEPDPIYRVEATVRTEADLPEVDLETSDDRSITYNRAFRFEFEIDSQSHTLGGYRRSADDPIFIPFRDKTTGQQTYEGGRYMELEPQEKLRDGDTIIIDFNLAYSPFCVYSETFSCPLPPEENWLETSIEAGERTLEW